MAYDYDAEIERLVKMDFDELFEAWKFPALRGFRKRRHKYRLFTLCGDTSLGAFGCPTMVRGNWDAQTAELTDFIRSIDGIPMSIRDLKPAWTKATRAKRRKLLQPFKLAQVATDKCLAKLARAKRKKNRK